MRYISLFFPASTDAQNAEEFLFQNDNQLRVGRGFNPFPSSCLVYSKKVSAGELVIWFLQTWSTSLIRRGNYLSCKQKNNNI